ncbi:Pentapeptide repeat-containing protein [Candidatus Electrothrix aarhusensis]|uniref:Pentapeptide repeat-containing protein n=1 Tax=Candidatus Electrothrix aarhusensis TaxID=1859131 RepID=A0A3S3UAJ3_9BACT|nr:Pentapeptide repeat-containing protein [Candidatus Electrothrix aarhusensis]
MAANIFSITGDEYDSYQNFKNAIRNNNISNALFLPDVFSSTQRYEKFKKITFRSISFKNTTFERIKFIDCHFAGCLFLSSKFIQCDFSNCTFKDCNFLGSTWEKSRINPKDLKKNFDFKNDANIAVKLFQALYDQYKKEHQPNYAKMAKYLFIKQNMA